MQLDLKIRRMLDVVIYRNSSRLQDKEGRIEWQGKI